MCVFKGKIVSLLVENVSTICENYDKIKALRKGEGNESIR